MPTAGKLKSKSVEFENAIAIFDLDGTLTRKDTFLAYLLTIGVRKRRFKSLAKLVIWCGMYLVRWKKDYKLKEQLVKEFISPFKDDIILEQTEWFIANWLPRNLHPVGYQLLQAHKEQGHRIILLSASPNIYVDAIARKLGIAEVICTKMKFENHHWLGQIEGHNCKGVIKRIEIIELLQTEKPPLNSYAYGDSKSDKHILSWVQNGFWIKKQTYRRAVSMQ